MINYSTRGLSFAIAMIMAIVLALSMVLAAKLSDGSVPWLPIVMVCVIVGFGVYYLLKSALKKFVSDQVKPISVEVNDYKGDNTEAKPEQPQPKPEPQVESDPDDNLARIISQVNDDVAQWAKDRTNEITILKNNEKFRREYINDMSHELRTPLFNLQGYIDTLLDGAIDDSSRNLIYLERASRNIARLTSIVDDMETISKLESGMITIQLAPVNIVSVIRECFDFYEEQAKKNNIEFVLNTTVEEPIMVMADRKRIYTVFSNLIVNSINYSDSGGVTTVSIFDVEGAYLFEVSDKGIGIPEESIGRVFERFYRVDKARSSNTGGTGLGLAIVKHIVEAHKAHVSVRSKLGVGTTFTLTLQKA